MPGCRSHCGLMSAGRAAVAVLATLVAAPTGAAKPEIRVIHSATHPETGVAVVCLEPRPLADPPLEPPLWRALRWGLFEVCESYKRGTIATGEYAATLEAYPALVVQLAALQALDRPAVNEPAARAITDLYRQLANNAALRVLCKRQMQFLSPQQKMARGLVTQHALSCNTLHVP